MGVIYTQNLNQNEQRAFPLDERSRRVSDNSLELPDNLIVALNIRFPDTAGQFVALSSVIVTDNLVSLTFVATDWTPFAVVGGIRVGRPIRSRERGCDSSDQRRRAGTQGWLERSGSGICVGCGAVKVPNGQRRACGPRANGSRSDDYQAAS